MLEALPGQGPRRTSAPSDWAPLRPSLLCDLAPLEPQCSHRPLLKAGRPVVMRKQVCGTRGHKSQCGLVSV